MLVFSLFILGSSVFAQVKKLTISGTLRSNDTGELLLGATIYAGPMYGTTTNEYGFYSLSLPPGNYILLAKYVGYQTDTAHIVLTQNSTLNIELKENASELGEVIVYSSESDNALSAAEMGTEKIDVNVINKVPVLFGEKDILKSIQQIPGIKAINQGSSGFSVRGGSADQNLILVDEAPVYNASHLLGFFSIFNSDAIKDVTVYKGTQPAQYGGRLSSVLDVRMNDGNKKKYESNVSLGLISSNVSLEGPLATKKSSFFVSARRTYFELLLPYSTNAIVRNSKIYFYDLNMKVNFQLGKKDFLYVSGYAGRDKLSIFENYGINWGNSTATLRWNHIVNSKCFSNTSFIFSDYDYLSDVNNSGNGLKLNSHIRDYNVKHEFQYFASAQHSIRAGFNSIYHTITPGKIIEKQTSQATGLGLSDRVAWENALYLADEWIATPWLNINAGLRLSAFSILGLGDFYKIDKDRNVVDTLAYTSSSIVKTYFNWEPRMTMSFLLTPASSIKVSYNRNVQNLHLIANNTTASPADKWIPSNNNIKPEISDQFSMGYFQSFDNNKFQFSVEGYYKRLENLIDYKDGADVFSNNAIETQILSGMGRAYGIEFYLKKKTGKFTGWLGYTLSKTENRINGINNDDWYPARQDKTHDISIILNYSLTPRINIACTWIYTTGNAVTYPAGKYVINQQTVWYYTDRNSYRMPAYHRSDIGATFKLWDRKHYSGELVIGVYNVYGRQNPYIINFKVSDTDPSRTEAVQTSLFQWIPSLSLSSKIR